jgi:hypothetical protein
MRVTYLLVVQRVQTLYLLMVTVLVSMTAVLPLVDLIGNDKKVYYQNALGVFETIGEGAKVDGTFSLQLILLLVVILVAIAIFSFRNRIFQLRVSYVCAALIALFYALFFLYETSIQTAFNAVANYRIALALPSVALILIWLAIKGIKRDEELVKSLNRIR